MAVADGDFQPELLGDGRTYSGNGPEKQLKALDLQSLTCAHVETIVSLLHFKCLVVFISRTEKAATSFARQFGFAQLFNRSNLRKIDQSTVTGQFFYPQHVLSREHKIKKECNQKNTARDEPQIQQPNKKRESVQNRATLAIITVKQPGINRGDSF